MDLSSLWPPSRIPYQFIYKSYKAISHNSDGQLEKEYLSLIKDPYDRGIVSCVLGYSANNQFVFDACDKVVHVFQRLIHCYIAKEDFTYTKRQIKTMFEKI